MGGESIPKCPGFERGLIIVPELIVCPFSSAEIEIWTDEKKIRCTHCGKMIGRKDALPVDVAGEGVPCAKNDPAGGEEKGGGPEIVAPSPKGQAIEVAEVRVLEHIDVSGSTMFYEEHERTVTVDAIEHGERYRDSCR
ncbi:MAG: hypothetical protein AB9873_18025 [Syntrophobacteraceae bacterium]